MDFFGSSSNHELLQKQGRTEATSNEPFSEVKGCSSNTALDNKNALGKRRIRVFGAILDPDVANHSSVYSEKPNIGDQPIKLNLEKHNYTDMVVESNKDLPLSEMIASSSTSSKSNREIVHKVFGWIINNQPSKGDILSENHDTSYEKSVAKRQNDSLDEVIDNDHDTCSLVNLHHCDGTLKGQVEINDEHDRASTEAADMTDNHDTYSLENQHSDQGQSESEALVVSVTEAEATEMIIDKHDTCSLVVVNMHSHDTSKQQSEAADIIDKNEYDMYSLVNQLSEEALVTEKHHTPLLNQEISKGQISDSQVDAIHDTVLLVNQNSDENSGPGSGSGLIKAFEQDQTGGSEADANFQLLAESKSLDISNEFPSSSDQPLPDNNLDAPSPSPTTNSGNCKHLPKKRRRRNVTTAFPRDAPSLFVTGVLDGVPVFYYDYINKVKTWAIIKQDSYLCGCQQCRFLEPLSAYDFVHHCGYNFRRANKLIYFKSGISVDKVVKLLQKTPPEKTIETLYKLTDSAINKENFRKWNWRGEVLASNQGSDHGTQLV